MSMAIAGPSISADVCDIENTQPPNEIPSDEVQRAAYDQPLDLARLEQEVARKRAAADPIGRIADGVACGVIFLAGAVVVSFGGHALLGLIHATPRAPAQMTQVSGQEPTQTTGTIGLSNTRGRTDRHNELEDIGAPKKLGEDPEDLKQTAAPSAATPAQVTTSAPASVAPVRDFATNDAKYYRERGISAYRTGDLHLALVEFDLAIQFDPSSSDAHIDRAIVLYRMGDRKRAFADVAQAKRIHHESNRNKTLSTARAP
jgi:tetratricopeptide (TPR) repeat protein